MGFFVWHHHVRFTRVITVGIWDPNVPNITSFYGKSTVQLSGESRIFPVLTEIGEHFVLLWIKIKIVSLGDYILSGFKGTMLRYMYILSFYNGGTKYGFLR